MRDYIVWVNGDDDCSIMIEVLNEDVGRILEIQKEYVNKGYIVQESCFPYIKLCKVNTEDE